VTTSTENSAALLTDRQKPKSDKAEKHIKAVALRTYNGNKPCLISQEQILELLPMVHSIASRTATYLKPPLSFEDLVSAGTLGLVKAARDYDPSHCAEFITYAYIKIKGAIIDELRSISPFSPEMNRRIKEAKNISRKFLEQTGYAPSDQQLADKLGISIDKLNDIYECARAKQFISIDNSQTNRPAINQLLCVDQKDNPENNFEQSELIQQLAEAIGRLEPKRRKIILLYYNQNLTMKQIAQLLDITESRVSQLHAGAIFNLFLQFRNLNDG
jgi:RNA polymerase sigma factor for flagellar operon FliA